MIPFEMNALAKALYDYEKNHQCDWDHPANTKEVRMPYIRKAHAIEKALKEAGVSVSAVT